MNQDETSAGADGPDASDIIEGPIGGARLKEPNTGEPTGADLEELPGFDRPQNEPEPDARG